MNPHSTQRRHRLLAGLGLALLAALPLQAQETYPNKPIRLVVPFTPGGVTDASGRLIADALGRRLGQQVIVDNKPGASGNIGSAQVVGAAADGYTLLLAFDGTMVINPHVFAKVPFDTVKDFAAVGKIGNATLILVAHPDVPARSLQELVALSKTKPLAYGTSGIGGTPHVAGEMLAQRTGARLEHVPYKGGGQAMIDVMGGSIPLVYTAVAGAQAHVKAGKLKAIAVSSAQRSSSLPDVPTFGESGVPDLVVDSWVGLLAPVRTPAAVLARLNSELNAVLNDPAVREKLALLGIDPTPGTPEQFRQQMQKDLAAYGPIVKAAQIKVE
ncbi:MAG: tripartite tricarboxylate transporter substrate binding protein [Rubrivivax sp.]|nr:tripartite tricarboxylate transporter substrate binding protein [Rubrivivax sp.]MDP3083353.1 tripartite tricarboxylate transporter substrate binding protein [Rubrivivax sp.]